MTQSIEAQKGQQACEILRELGLGCWLVWVRETKEMPDPVLKLILGGDLVWQSALIFTQAGERIAIVGSLDVGGVEPRGLFDRIVPYVEGIGESLREELARIDPRQIAINISRDDVAADGLTVGMHGLLKEYLQGTPYGDRLVSAEALVGHVRGRKLPEELERIEQAVAITEQIFDEARGFLKVGQSELEIHRLFHERMKALGVTPAWHPDHNPAVDAGPNKAFGHCGPTDNKTKAGQLLHFDFGVRYQGYCSDLQRVMFLGEPEQVPEEVQQAFDTVRDAIGEAARFIRPGVRGHEVDAVARQLVQQRGYPGYPHALGHQVGRNAHDGGTILGPLWERYGDTPNGVVEAENVFTLELHVPTEHFGPMSLEEDIVVTEKGSRFLSHPQEALICLG